jgi:hypothetical protein
MRFASSSPMTSSFTGSPLQRAPEALDHVGHMARGNGAMRHFGVGVCLFARLDAVEERPHVVVLRVTAFKAAVAEQRLRVGFDFAGVAGLDPALGALEAYRAGAETQPAADDQLRAVLVLPVEALAFLPELYRAGVVGLVGPLADVDRVASPLGDGAAAEINVRAPEAARRRLPVEGAPLRWPEPAVPVEFLTRGLRLAGENALVEG